MAKCDCGFAERVIFLIFEKIMCAKLKTLLAIIAMMAAVSLSLGFVSYSPQEQPSAAESSVEIRRARIVAAGDLMQHTPQLTAALRSDGRYDYSTSFQYVAPYFQDADLAIVNLETTLSYEGPYSGYPAFCSPAAVADALRDMDIDVVAMANNHCCDKGGAVIEYSTIFDKQLTNKIKKAADGKNLQYQIWAEGVNLGTDADMVQTMRCGVKTTLVSVPIRNMHTPVEVADLSDVESAADIIAAYLETYLKEDVK